MISLLCVVYNRIICINTNLIRSNIASVNLPNLLYNSYIIILNIQILFYSLFEFIVKTVLLNLVIMKCTVINIAI